MQAEAFKSQGNEAFKSGKWVEAVAEYTKAIELDPDDKVYYSNRWYLGQDEVWGGGGYE